MTSTPSSALRALLTGSVDYAGLFPPAGLALEPALENHSGYTHGEEAWMLGCFVLPTTKLPEAGRLLSGRFDGQYPLRISALGSKGNSADEFSRNLRVHLREAADIPQEHRRLLAITQFEAALPPGVVPNTGLGELLSDAARLIGSLMPGQLRVFWEVPFTDDLSATLHGIADHNSRNPPAAYGYRTPRFQPDGRLLYYSPVAGAGRCQPFGVKLRTGGTEAAAFPSCERLAAALLAARDAGVAVKFTAGLHHPIRHFDAGLDTRMHGFLNVFTAGILAREHQLDLAETVAILEDEEAANFRFDADGLAWRDRWVFTGALPAHREFVTSFGSCSFDEPRDDLRALGLM